MYLNPQEEVLIEIVLLTKQQLQGGGGLVTEQINMSALHLWPRTHLRLLDSAFLEGTRARVVGAVMPVFAPVALVRTAHARNTSKWRDQIRLKGGGGLVLNSSKKAQYAYLFTYNIQFPTVSESILLF